MAAQVLVRGLLGCNVYLGMIIVIVTYSQVAKAMPISQSAHYRYNTTNLELIVQQTCQNFFNV